MGLWSWIDNAGSYLPVKGPIKDIYEAKWQQEVSNPMEATFDAACDAVTYDSLGTHTPAVIAGKRAAFNAIDKALKEEAEEATDTKAEESTRKAAVALAAVTAAQSAKATIKINHQRKRKDGTSLSSPPKSLKRSCKDDLKQGYHVINNDVLGIFEYIIEKYISDHCHRFFGMSYAQLVEGGKITPDTCPCLLKSHDNPLPADVTNKINEMVAHTPVGKEHTDPIESEFAGAKLALVPLCIDIIENVIQSIDDADKANDDKTNIYYVYNQIHFLTDIINSINQSTPSANGVFVDEQARMWWAAGKSQDEATFKQCRDAVRNMFSSLTPPDVEERQDSLVFKWARELLSVSKALIEEHKNEGSEPVYQLFMVSTMLFPPNKNLSNPVLGHEIESGSDFCCAVANTKWGKIPGKAKDKTCLYAYGDEEFTTSDFTLLDSPQTLRKIKNDTNVMAGESHIPKGAVCSGVEKDGENYEYYYSAVAETTWGNIPGKAKGDKCWYSYNGKGYETSEFFWVVRGLKKMENPMLTLERNSGSGPSNLTLKLAEGSNAPWCAVADCMPKWGRHPGKANGNTCWYSWGSREYYTDPFYWLDSASPIATVPNKGYAPCGAIQCGKEEDGNDLFAAIANSEWGKIPGKARGPTCWYGYEGKAYYTSNFEWAIVE